MATASAWATANVTLTAAATTPVAGASAWGVANVTLSAAPAAPAPVGTSAWGRANVTLTAPTTGGGTPTTPTQPGVYYSGNGSAWVPIASL